MVLAKLINNNQPVYWRKYPFVQAFGNNHLQMNKKHTVRIKKQIDASKTV